MSSNYGESPFVDCRTREEISVRHARIANQLEAERLAAEAKAKRAKLPWAASIRTLEAQSRRIYSQKRKLEEKAYAAYEKARASSAQVHKKAINRLDRLFQEAVSRTLAVKKDG